MKRWHDEQHIMRRQLKLKNVYRAEPTTQIGRCRKRHGLDCGYAKCRCCHSDKFPRRRLTIDEINAANAQSEQLKELDME